MFTCGIAPSRVRQLRVMIFNLMKRPRPHALPSADIERLAGAAKYVGSREHKRGHWWGGQGRAPGPGGQLRRPKKQITTVCPLNTLEDQAKATRWIREAISAGRFLFVEGDKRFPKHVWHETPDGRTWIGRCVNSEQGEYKGWPAAPDDVATLEGKRQKQ